MKFDKFFRINSSAIRVFIMLLFCAPLVSIAQDEEAPTESISTNSVGKTTNFRFGIHASPNISYISTKAEGMKTPANVKFGFGLIAIFNFADNYAVSSGINIVSKGGEMNRMLGDTLNLTGDYSSQYLQIPIQLRMSTREFGYSTFFATFGGSIDLRLSEETSLNPKPATEIDSYVQFFNAMFTIGAGMEYNLGGNTSLVAGIYYNQSLINNLSKDPVYPLINIEDDRVYRFDYISLQVGVLF